MSGRGGPVDDPEAPPSPQRSQSRMPYVLRRTSTARERRRSEVSSARRACFRLLQNPYVFAMCLIAIMSIGFGMIQPLVVELRARSHGEWFGATCIVESLVLTPKEERLRTYRNPKTLDHRGGDLWYFVAAYNVSVRFDDGCDDDPNHRPKREEELQNEREEEEDGFFVEENSPPPPSPPPAAPPSASESVDAADAAAMEKLMAENAAVAGADSNASSAVATAPAPAPEHCAGEWSRRLDRLRGHHIAFYKLVLSHEDYCVGPVGGPEQEAFEHCQKTSRLWFHHKLASGEKAKCWVFEQQVHGESGTHVHVVLSREVPLDIWFYVAYWGVIVLLLLRAIYLFGRHWAYRAGYLKHDYAPHDDEIAEMEARTRRRSRLSVNTALGEPMPDPYAPKPGNGSSRSRRSSSSADRRADVPLFDEDRGNRGSRRSSRRSSRRGSQTRSTADERSLRAAMGSKDSAGASHGDSGGQFLTVPGASSGIGPRRKSAPPAMV